ncbi:hypothetical protein GH714_028361 [Hevea brasiliensis]|uniref:DWNN domain-containing protein n=1 Tax=Hevea brasiliensis TaxID=3981 RepID=A0A6A6LWZ0_HEVBR|nr:hypothetical protein GH714_028361 [Hevea brasiliensis]
MPIYFKFFSAKEYDSISVDGSVISVDALKRKIFEYKYKSNMKSHSNGLCFGTDFDLVVINAQTNDCYVDDMLIPNNTRVLIRRIPGTRRGKPVDTATIVVIEKQQPLSSSYRTGSSNTETVVTASSRSTPVNTGVSSVSASTITSLSSKKCSGDASFGYDNGFGDDVFVIPRMKPAQSSMTSVDVESDEDSKIKALVNTPALDWQLEGSIGVGSRTQGVNGRGCGRMDGHSFGGLWGRKRLQKVIYVTGVRCRDILFSIAQQMEIQIMISKDLMMMLLRRKFLAASLQRDPGLDHLIISKLKCVCGAVNVLADSLIPNMTLRDTINCFVKSSCGNSSSGENAKSSCFRVMDVESAHCSQPQISTTKLPAGSFQESKKTTLYNIEDEGNKRKLLDDPYQIAKKARTTRAADVSEATIGSTRMKDTASQGSVLVVEEDVQQEVGMEGYVAPYYAARAMNYGLSLRDYFQWHDESSLFQYAANVWQAMKLLDTAGSYTSPSLKLANEIIGTIAPEVVLKAKHRDSGTRYLGKVDLSQIGEFHVTGSPASYYSAIQRLHSENRWQ